MADNHEPLARALGEMGPEGETAESLAARLPVFPREAIEEALEMLTAAGVLRREPGPDSTPRYFYADPSRYKLTEMDVVRRPDGATRRRG